MAHVACNCGWESFAIGEALNRCPNCRAGLKHRQPIPYGYRPYQTWASQAQQDMRPQSGPVLLPRRRRYVAHSDATPSLSGIEGMLWAAGGFVYVLLVMPVFALIFSVLGAGSAWRAIARARLQGRPVRMTAAVGMALALFTTLATLTYAVPNAVKPTRYQPTVFTTPTDRASSERVFHHNGADKAQHAERSYNAAVPQPVQPRDDWQAFQQEYSRKVAAERAGK